MALKWKEITLLIDEARPLLEGSSIQKIAQAKELAGGESFLLHGYGDEGGWRLWTCLQQAHTTWVLAEDDWEIEAMPEPSTFVMVLRKRVIGQRISGIEQVPGERMVFFHLENGLSLFFELFPKKANLILCEQWNKEAREFRCIHSFRQVSLEPGAIYKLPPPNATLPASEIRDLGQDGTRLSFHKAVAELYWGLVHKTGFSTYKQAWKRVWKSQAKKMKTALDNATGDLEEAREAELFQKRGMALVAKLYELGPKAYPKEKKIELDELEIPLDTSKSFSENADVFFRKAKKMHRAVGELEERAAALTKKQAELDRLGKAVDEAEDEEELEKLGPAFEKAGMEPPERVADAEKKETGPKPFLEVESSDGFYIYCGRNQEENRRVTFQEAKGNDMWLHVKGTPGAHVVIKGQRNKTIPLRTLLEAAQLCLYHSKIRKGKRAEVDYTQRKHVRAIKGTFAEVTYTGNKTLYVEADPEELKKIMKSN